MIDFVPADSHLFIGLIDNFLVVKDRIMVAVHAREIIRCSIIEAEKFIPSIEGHHFLAVSFMGFAKQPTNIPQLL